MSWFDAPVSLCTVLHTYTGSVTLLLLALKFVAMKKKIHDVNNSSYNTRLLF